MTTRKLRDRAPGGHVYGPVPSRRFGASLGVDAVPYKICSFDCTYCQLGPTGTLTARRRRFYPVETILAEVAARLADGPAPDVITLAGSGEPTLDSGLGELIAGLKRLAAVPVVLLTNGSLFYRPAVRAAAAKADIVVPSLDAGDEATFQAINRPAPGLTLARVVSGLEAFRASFQGRLWLEVMVMDGVNDSPEQLAGIAALARRIGAEKVQLNTPVRPTFDERARPVSAERLAACCAHFDPPAEPIADFRARGPGAEPLTAADDERVLALLGRRPCTLDDLAAGLQLHPAEVGKALGRLERAGAIAGHQRGGRRYWIATRGDQPPSERGL